LGDGGRVIKGRSEDAEPNERSGLLGTYGKRPEGRRAAKQRNEFTPFQLVEHLMPRASTVQTGYR